MAAMAHQIGRHSFRHRHRRPSHALKPLTIPPFHWKPPCPDWKRGRVPRLSIIPAACLVHVACCHGQFNSQRCSFTYAVQSNPETPWSILGLMAGESYSRVVSKVASLGGVWQRDARPADAYQQPLIATEPT